VTSCDLTQCSACVCVDIVSLFELFFSPFFMFFTTTFDIIFCLIGFFAKLLHEIR
jgi:hypothetical protein